MKNVKAESLLSSLDLTPASTLRSHDGQHRGSTILHHWTSQGESIQAVRNQHFLPKSLTLPQHRYKLASFQLPLTTCLCHELTCLLPISTLRSLPGPRMQHRSTTSQTG